MPSPKTRVRRLPKRAAYDRETIHAILDEGLVCHLGFVTDGQPYVIPTSYGRAGDTLYLHGSSASRALRVLQTGLPVCVTVTLADGLVLARSGFHHSMNYRSVVVLGVADAVTEPDAKLEGLRVITEHLIPGRWNDIRPPSTRELKATAVLSLPLAEASAKVRSGPPSDDEEDYELDVWAGVIPLRTQALPPVPDPLLSPGAAVPDYASAYKRPGPSA